MLTKKLILPLISLIIVNTSCAQENVAAPEQIITKFFKNGQIQSIEVVIDEKKNGIQIELDKNGRIIKQENYLFGVLQGKQIFYNRGRVEKSKNYENGKLDGPVESYGRNRKLSSTENYKEGIKSGKSIWYYYKGNTCAEYNYEGGKIVGEAKFFHENDSLKYILTFENNEIEGEYIEYDDKGNVVVEGEYKNGLKEGKWKYYSSEGKLIETKKYKEGVKK